MSEQRSSHAVGLAAAPPVEADQPATGSTVAARPGRSDLNRRTARVAVIAGSVATALVLVPSGMSLVARLTLALFTVMLSLTAFTKVNEVAVCVATLVALVLVGGSSVGDSVGALSNDTIWLLVGAFVVAAAAKRSGIAQRLAFAIGRGAGSVDQLMLRITGVIVLTAFLVPSTSGRAALMLPVYVAFAEQIEDRRVRRALAVLFPSAILLSAVASLFGAGAHLVTSELVSSFGGERIGFLQWTVYGLPFAAASSLTALLVVRWTFLDRATRQAPVTIIAERSAWNRREVVVTTVVAGLTLCWLTEEIHGVDAWVAAMVAAVLVVGPLRVTTVAEARSALPIDLLVIMAVTAEAGSALARTGAADWIAGAVLGPLVGGGGSPLVIVLVVGCVSLLAHLVVTSRTARASVLLPVVILIGAAGGLNITALAYLSTAAAGYCLTTTTSAKPMRVFSTVDDGYDATDLRRLSLRLFPAHVLLLLGFAFLVWPVLGLKMTDAASASSDVPFGRSAGADASPYPWSDAVIDGLGIGPRWASSPVATAGEPPSDRELAPHDVDVSSNTTPLAPAPTERSEQRPTIPHEPVAPLRELPDDAHDDDADEVVEPGDEDDDVDGDDDDRDDDHVEIEADTDDENERDHGDDESQPGPDDAVDDIEAENPTAPAPVPAPAPVTAPPPPAPPVDDRDDRDEDRDDRDDDRGDDRDDDGDD